jgi:hypothetical protein
MCEAYNAVILVVSVFFFFEVKMNCIMEVSVTDHM